MKPQEAIRIMKIALAVEKGFCCEDDGWIIDGYLDWITPDVTAWMLTPEPYKGE